MPKKSTNKETIKSVDAIRHTDDKRKNIPTIEYRPMVSDDQQSPVPVKYPRNTDLDPQLVWRGKDEQDWSDLVVHAPPLYIQEKVHPKVLIDDLIRMAGDRESAKASDKKSSGQVQYTQLSLFDDFNGVPDGDAKTEFYQHDQHWSNRMILGDSLQVMASLAEREGLRGKVQCIYFDPPYGIKFNSNFQWSTTSRDVKDGNASHITREPDPKSSLATTHQTLLASFWQARIARQKEIDASIAAKAEFEYLYDKPYEDKKKVRVAGPFTVESLSPHRMLGIDENDELVDIGQGSVASGKGGYDKPQDFPTMILENLRAAGVQQAHKDGRIEFTSLVAWPGELVCAEGTYQSDPATDPTNHSSTNPQPSSKNNSSSTAADSSKRAAIFIGPEFGTVQRQDLVLAAREASDAGFDVLIACAFNFDAMSTEFNKLGRIPVLKARMNADLHMADDLKNTGKGNLFVIFGEPDVELLQEGFGSMRVKVNGVDVFHPNTGEVRSDGPEGIACWFIDTDYNEESFFVRHAYFLGQNDPYTALKTTLKAEIDADAWSTLNSAISRPFPRPLSGRIAVKVINHLGDEVMKVFRV
jgi:hypothetical protein